MTPGSNEARDKGCTCSAMMNNRGLGFVMPGHETLFLKDENCSLHGIEAEIEKEADENR